MFKLSVFAIAAVVAAALAPAPQSGSAKALLDGHKSALKDAQAIAIIYTVQRVPAAPAEHKLAFAKPALFRIETPSGLTVADGSGVWEYDKADNSYIESASSEDAAVKRALEADTWVWAAFFAPDPFKDAKNIALGAKRNLRGVTTQEVNFSLPDDRAITLYIDTKTGIAKGGLIKTSAGETLLLASEITIDGDAVSPDAFKFTPPAGAEKLEKPKEKPVMWADVSPIFSSRCVECHGTSGGLTLTSRDASLQSKSIVPGDPAASSLMASIKWTSGTRMPKDRPKLAQEQIDLIEKWIAQGAK